MSREKSFWIAPLLLCASLTTSAHASNAHLTFEQRVTAQRAIDRVYYSHQQGAKLPFDQAMPREATERKVLDYMRQSSALNRQWRQPITALMLREEAQRIARSTRMPERLTELHAALGHDPVLVLECLVRPVLASRLARARFASDSSLQAAARNEAAELHARLLAGSQSLGDDDPRRSVLDSSTPEGKAAIELLRERDMRALRHAGRVGDIADLYEAFEIPVVLEESPDTTKVAVYAVPKRSWDEWWSETGPTFDAARVETLATPSDTLPEINWQQVSTATPLLGCVNNAWDTGGTLAPHEFRVSPRAIWTGSRMIVWGGAVGGSLVNTGSRYDPITDTDTPTTTIGAPSGRSAHTAVWTGSRMIIWGGYDGIAYVSTGASYDPIADTWSPISMSDAPSGRSNHTGVWTGSHMLIWGGFYSPIFGSPRLNTGAQYDPQHDLWTPMTTVQAPTARNSHTAVWTGDTMIVWGGNGDSGRLSTGGRYDPQSNTWTATTTLGAPEARSAHSAVWISGRMIVWGGRNSAGNALATGGMYDPALDNWTATSLTAAASARGFHTAVAAGGAMIVWGGEPVLAWAPGTGGRFDPMTNTWSPITTTGAPRARANHTAVWTGSQMIIWGGSPDGGELHARYDQATDTWNNSLRVPRTNSGQAIWTGTHMIIGDGTFQQPFDRYDPVLDSWVASSMTGAPTGGSTGVGPPVWTGQYVISMGKRYDPNADTWSAISLVNAPTSVGPVSTHMIALWTGSEMILWNFSTGGRYNPATDSWTPMSIYDAGGPVSHSNYKGVWSGNRMIVWGGYDDINKVTRGGRYNPVTDTWALTSIVNEPLPRVNFGAVWAGGRMVVWGGYGRACLPPPPQGCTGTDYWPTSGGSYNPVTDTWTAFTGIGGREQVTAVSTGTEAVFWGGDTCGNPGCSGWEGPTYQDGFRYNPQTGAVAPLTTLNAPAARAASAAVWAGDQIFVWGGFIYSPSTSPLLDGGRYTLSSDADADGFVVSCDCDDTDPAVYPAGPQVCDGLNNDCNAAGWPSLAGTNEGDDDTDGFTECGGDCDDLTGATHPGASEINDGKDNQCTGDQGFGWTDELVNDLVFPDADNTRRICWSAQPGATSYVVARATDASMGTNSFCVAPVTATCDEDAAAPSLNQIFFYLVRAQAPFTGSWGGGSSGAETFAPCGTAPSGP